MKWLFTIIFFISLPVFAETVYKTVDANGRVSYTDKPPAQGKVTKTLTFADLPSSPLPESALRSCIPQSGNSKKNAPNYRNGAQPLLFYAQWCGYCRQARAYLAEKNIQYREYDVDTPDGGRAFAELGTGKGIPVLVHAGKTQRGFSRQGYDTFFANQ
jgi:glutaredoxin